MMRVLTFALVVTFVLAGASLDTRAQSDAPPNSSKAGTRFPQPSP